MSKEELLYPYIIGAYGNRTCAKSYIQKLVEENKQLKERIDKVIELTKKLLEVDEIEIDGVKYYKGNADDLIAKEYLRILGDSNG